MDQHYHLQTETITTVSIGTGQTLSPYADFVLDEEQGNVYYINHDTVKKALAQKPELIDEYVNGVSMMDNNRSNFQLSVFLKTKLEIDIRKTALKSYKLSASAKGLKQLYTIIKNAGIHPYIPGSSVKGAIKTALLYDWLWSENENNKKWLRNYLTARKQEERDQLTDTLELQLNKYQPNVSDSSLFDSNCVAVYDTKRLHLKSGKLTIPQTWEAISAGNAASLSISVIRKADTEWIDWETMCDKINKYSYNNVAQELDLLEALGSKIPQSIFNPLFDFNEKIFDRLQNAQSGTAYMRIGSGKGYFFNSIGLGLHDIDESDEKTDFRDFLKKNGYGKVYKKETRRWEGYDLKGDEFPLTRPIDVHSYLPLGWVKLEKL